MERAAKLSGTRFVYRKGDSALTELALYRFALDRLVAKGFVPVLPRCSCASRRCTGRASCRPTRCNIYRVERDDLYLTGTSEVALAALHMEEILADDDLPLRYAGYSTCFRREAGAAGKDTRGMFRVHQFDKIEMFSFVEPDASPDEHEHLLAIEEELVQELDIPYRVVNVAAGDLGLSASRSTTSRRGSRASSATARSRRRRTRPTSRRVGSAFAHPRARAGRRRYTL